MLGLCSLRRRFYATCGSPLPWFLGIFREPSGNFRHTHVYPMSLLLLEKKFSVLLQSYFSVLVYFFVRCQGNACLLILAKLDLSLSHSLFVVQVMLGDIFYKIAFTIIDRELCFYLLVCYTFILLNFFVFVYLSGWVFPIVHSERFARHC